MKCVESNIKVENNGADTGCLCNLQIIIIIIMEHAQNVLNEYHYWNIERN